MLTPMPHQERAINDMADGASVLLVWEPGTGKTLPVVRAAIDRAPVLVIVPAHLRLQWAGVFANEAPSLRVRVLMQTKQPAGDLSGADVVIVSYKYVSTAKRWRELRLHPGGWGAIAVDECHALMSLEANRTVAILGQRADETHGLIHAADCQWYLTGTPFTFPNEIWPILSRSFPEATRRSGEQPGLMTAREWENQFCSVAPDPSGFGDKIVGARNVPELRDRLSGVIDKVRLRDIAHDMPECVIDEIPMRENLRKLMSNLPPDIVSQYETLMEILSDDTVDEDNKLSAVNDSGLVMAQIRHHIAIAKIGAMTDLIKEELRSGVDKLLVFGWHKQPITTLAEKTGAITYTGSLNDREKESRIRRFVSDHECRVLVAQASAAGEGLDGLQHVCHRGLFFETPWAYRENKQCWHRLDRKGQTLPVHLSYATLLDTIDEYVVAAMRKKGAAVSAALD